MRLISDIEEFFLTHGIETEILAASIRCQQDMVCAVLAGVDVSAIPYKLIC